VADPWAQGPYANETYLRSLAKSAGDVDRQVGNALTEIGRQRQVAGAQTAKIPGATNVIFNDGLSGLAKAGQAFGVTAPSEAVARAFTRNRDSMGVMAGLYNKGFGERETRQKGGVKNVSQELINDLRMKGTEYVSKRQQEDRDRQHQERMAAQQRALQMEMMRRQEAMQRQAQAAAMAEAEKQRAIELWIARQDMPWPEDTSYDKAAVGRYLNRHAKNKGLL
jgi:hypothetical protein